MRNFFSFSILLLFIFMLQQRSHTPLQTNTEEIGWTESIHPRPVNPVLVYTTASNTDHRLAQTGQKYFEPAKQPLETEVAIFVNPARQFQTFLGIGGALTDASAEVFASLSETNQKKLLEAYYSVENGIGYSLARTTIHSCDFSKKSYTYVEEGDTTLESFSIEHDLAFRIPFIRKAIAAAGGNLTLYASPWSPPAYMKTNKSMLHGGKLMPEFYATWASYFTRFIQAYEAAGIPVWGLTIQNEPMAKQRWESCIFTAQEERDFLKNHLGPTLKKAGMEDKKIIVWDHNRDLINHRVNTILEDPDASQYVWGVGFHWYETWTGSDPLFMNLKEVNAGYPDKNLIFTEGCNEGFDPKKYEHWPNAERYGRSLINDFNNGTVGWTDWNVLLDEKGGPNHVGNYCFAPVHADTQTDSLLFTPAYYYIGHFSKFIRPGAKRVSTTTNRSDLLSTSFLNTDGSLVTVVMNQSEHPISYKLLVIDEAIQEDIAPHSIQTLIY